MSNVLEFPGPDRRLRRALLDVQDDVARISETLRTLAIRLATDGVWREWSDAMPEGSVMTFEPQMMLESGDPTVKRLVELDLATEALVEVIEERLHCRRLGKRLG